MSASATQGGHNKGLLNGQVKARLGYVMLTFAALMQ